MPTETLATYAPPEGHAWHHLDVAKVVETLKTGAEGLRAAEARRRLEMYGPNELQAPARGAVWHVLASQFKNRLIVILLVATALSGLLGHGLEAAVIAVIVLFAVLLGSSRSIGPNAPWRPCGRWRHQSGT